MQFFISASGCKGKITAQMQSSMEHAAIIRRMTEEFDEVKIDTHNISLVIYFFNVSIYFFALILGKWGIPYDYVWSSVEEVSMQLL